MKVGDIYKLKPESKLIWPSKVIIIYIGITSEGGNEYVRFSHIDTDDGSCLNFSKSKFIENYECETAQESFMPNYFNRLEAVS